MARPLLTKALFDYLLGIYDGSIFDYLLSMDGVLLFAYLLNVI
jgi:hypothetical protein